LIGSVTVPGDKSCTQRALLLGAVAEGRTRVGGALRAGDTLATAGVAAALGARVDWPEAGALAIEGTAAPARPEGPLDCANAGTAARLLLGLLAGRPGRWTIDGDASLRRRPMGRVVLPLSRLGAHVERAATLDDGGWTLPLVVEGRALNGGEVEVEVASAQVKSALLLAGLVAAEPLTVVQHVPTRDHTERMLGRFGVTVEIEPGRATVHPGRPVGATLDVPGDPSSAAFLVVAGLLTTGSDVWVRNVGLWPRRTGFLRALERAGADLMIMRRETPATDGGPAPRSVPELGETAMTKPLAGAEQGIDPVGDLRAGHGELTAFDIAPEDVPDLIDELPVLALAAARARGTSRFGGLSELRVKESDRLAAIAALLEALGVPVTLHEDGLSITGVEAFRRPGRWPATDDHRMALTSGVAALSAGWPLPDLAVAAISFPGFAACVGRLRSGGLAS
jgi:3-phosphoshikimate 1-carboxyvinyltransferase